MNNKIDGLKAVEDLLYGKKAGIPNSKMEDRPSDEIIAAEKEGETLEAKIAHTKGLLTQFNDETHSDDHLEEAC